MSDIILKKKNVPLSLSMDTAKPLDYNSVFTDFDSATAAAKTAVEIGGETSRYFFGQNIIVADSEKGVYRTYRIQTDGTLKELAAEYSAENGLTERLSETGVTYFGLESTFYYRCGMVYLAVMSSSANWTSTFGTMRSLSSTWNDTATNFAESSSISRSVYNTVNSLSGYWNNTYLTVNSHLSRWDSTYFSLKSLSANWNDVYLKFSSLSSGWNEISTSYRETSASANSVYGTVNSLSSDWNSAFSDVNRIISVTPDDVWITGNQFADKKYVETAIAEQLGTFRGSFNTWLDVPITSSGYNVDIYGSRTPKNNDYIVVLDDSFKTMAVLVESNPVGETIAVDVVVDGETLLFAGDVITEDDVTSLKTHGVESVTVYKTGSWRYRFVGTWVEGTEGKNCWSSEYRISNTVFTNAQIEALNSGITKSRVAKIAQNERDIFRLSSLSSEWNNAATETMRTSADYHGLYSTVTSASGDWQTVNSKVNTDYFNYYSSSSWSDLTNDDTDYSNVPSGMILIYEDDGSDIPVTPSGTYSVYSGDTEILTLSKNITFDYDFGILTIGGNAVFDSDTNTLTIPGSSDVYSGAYFNTEDGFITLSKNAVWDEKTGIITLSPKDTYNSTTGMLVMQGSSSNSPSRTTFTITNRLTHATNRNTLSYITSGAQYIAVINADTGYTFTTLTCTMGGISIDKTGDSSFNITSVTGDIVITAVASESVTTKYTITNTLVGCDTDNDATEIDSGESYNATITAFNGYTIDSRSCLMNNEEQIWDGNSITIGNVIGNIIINVHASVNETSKASFYTSTGILSLGADTYYEDSIGTLYLGECAEYDESTGIVTLSGESRESPGTYYSVTKNLTNVSCSNSSSNVKQGEKYYAVLSPYDENYQIASISCTMGGVEQPITSKYVISIAEVTGDIVISATANRISRAVYYANEELLKLSIDANYVESTGIVTFGRNAKFDKTTNVITLSGFIYSGEDSQSSFNETDGVIVLSKDSSYEDGMISLGKGAVYFDSDNMLRLEGSSYQTDDSDEN